MRALDWILGKFSVDMGIDLGTANTLVCVKGKGIVLNEPSVVAVRKGTTSVLLNGRAVGSTAKEMLGKTPANIVAIRPMKDGVIADFEITEAMLKYFIYKVHGRNWAVSPRIVIAVPTGITPVERRAVINSAERAGARRVYLMEEPMAAAIGCGLPFAEPRGSMIVDIGGGTTEVAILSLGGIVVKTSIRIAGDEMDQAIVNHLRNAYDLLVGEQTAETVKITIGSAYPLKKEVTMEVRGLDSKRGLPKKVVVTSEEIREAVREPINGMIDAVKETLQKCPPELAGDLIEQGVTLAGGGALLRGVGMAIGEAVGLPVHLADDPLTAVARGTGVFLDNLSEVRSILDQADDR
ncbi:MAG: rod shape-determining protein [Planctomycetota bacterium]|nr:rod shape-determining protein [Planctomycetota bacterium]